MEEEQADQIKEQKRSIIEVATSSSIFRYVLGAMIAFGICFVASIFVFQVVMTQVGVQGYSMQPTINANAVGVTGDKNTDTVFCIKTSELEYKDIVIIDEHKTGEKLIKRVIGTPGQTITFKSLGHANQNAMRYFRYELYIDGVKLEEDYIKEQNCSLAESELYMQQYPFYAQLLSGLAVEGEFSFTLENGQYFCMGDNRNHSTDSRYFGPIDIKEIIGKVVLHVRAGQTLIAAIWSAIF